MYLTPDEFLFRFPLGSKIGEGTYSKVYQSGDYVVKQQDIGSEGLLTVGVKELNFYSMLDHPNIAKIVAWTYVINTGGAYSYLALPRGTPISQAAQTGWVYNKSLGTQIPISIQEIAQALLSAVSFLNANRIVHGDIKDANIIYDDGVKLIDFGLATLAYPRQTPEGIRDYVTGVLYSEIYRDPEYYMAGYNLISCEMYAIGRTIWSLFEKSRYQDPVPLMQRSFLVPPLGNPELDQLIQILTLFPSSQRPSITSLVPPEGQLLTTSVQEIDPRCGKDLLSLERWLVQICVDFKLMASTGFLILHLLRRCLGRIYPNYATDQRQFKMIRLVAIVCLYLISNIHNLNLAPSRSDCLSLVREYSDTQFWGELVSILDVTNGILLTPTYWDYARYFEDLPQLLLDTISCSYDPKYIRPLRKTGRSKEVPFSEVVNEIRDKLRDIGEIIKISQPEVYYMPHVYPISFPVISRATHDNFVESIAIKAEAIFRGHYDILRAIIHYREWLPDLSLDNAIQLYKTIQSTPQGKEMLPNLVKFTSEDVPFQTLGIHPFRASQDEIEAKIKSYLSELFQS